MTTAQEAADKLREEAAAKLAEAERLAKLQEAFPDLKRHVNRWNTVRFYSPAVNSKVQRFDIKHNCGCCNDSPLEVWPYIETEHGRVYSDPPVFQVGEKHWMGGDTPYPGWEDKLKAAGIPEIIIGAIGVHFEDSRELRISLAEDS